MDGLEEEDKELLELEEDILNPRNFHNNLYKDDNFRKIKEQLAEDLINMETVEMKQRKDLLYDVNKYLDDHNNWK